MNHLNNNLMCIRPKELFSLEYSEWIFTCDDGTYIANIYICDDIKQCITDIQCSMPCIPSFTGITTHDHKIPSLCFTKDCVMSDCQCIGHYFQCWSGGCILAAKLCDGTYDCSDKSDEMYCDFVQSSMIPDVISYYSANPYIYSSSTNNSLPNVDKYTNPLN